MLAELILKVAGMEKRERGKYRPRASMSGPDRCIRQMAYHAAGTPEDKAIGDRFMLTMDDSAWHETLTTDWIGKTAYKFHSSQLAVDVPAIAFVPDTDAFESYHCDVCGAHVLAGNLHGHIDGIITDLLDVERVLEHKALNHFSFIRYASGEHFPLDYIAQSCMYVYGVSLWNPAVTSALLLIKNKNTAQYLEMIIEYDKTTDTATINVITMSTGEVRRNADGTPLLVIQNILRDAFQKFVDVHSHVKQKVLPPRPFGYGTDFPCGYCSWQDTCWASYAFEVDQLGKDADLIEMEDTARFHAELGAQIGELKKQRDEVGRAIKSKLAELSARKGRAGEYLIDFQLREEERVKSKDEISPDLLPLVLKKEIKEVLIVRKIIPKKEKNK